MSTENHIKELAEFLTAEFPDACNSEEAKSPCEIAIQLLKDAKRLKSAAQDVVARFENAPIERVGILGIADLKALERLCK